MATQTKTHRPLVVSGPSGTGKSTLLNKLFTEFPDTFGFSVSHTTRSPRQGEEEGKQYYFVDQPTFQKMIEEGKFIEHAEFSGNLYGTSVDAVKKVAETGKIAVLDVDMQGVKSVKTTDLNARYVFIKPPSLEILEERLRSRNTEKEDAIKERLATAKIELEYADQAGSHDLIIVNDNLDDAYAKLKAYVVDITTTGGLTVDTSGATVDKDGATSPGGSTKSKKGKKEKEKKVKTPKPAKSPKTPSDGTKKSKHCIIL